MKIIMLFVIVLTIGLAIKIATHPKTVTTTKFFSCDGKAYKMTYNLTMMTYQFWGKKQPVVSAKKTIPPIIWVRPYEEVVIQGIKITEIGADGCFISNSDFSYFSGDTNWSIKQ